MAALVDIGVFREAFVDEERFDFIKECIQLDFGLSEAELKERMNFFKTGLRPISPDECSFIGPLTHFPNVLLNGGYGPYGYYSFAGGKILESTIFRTGEAEKLLSKDIVDWVHP
jgi:hypothetical protein